VTLDLNRFKASRQPSKKERTKGRYYWCPEPWADAAAEAAGPYTILAFRIYRLWLWRESGATEVAITTASMRGPGNTEIGRRRVVKYLAAAGLIEVLPHQNGCALRVRVIELCNPEGRSQ
jgi:hypothetical protein